MQNKLAILITVIGILLTSTILYGESISFDSLPPFVEYSIEVPHRFNATEFKFNAPYIISLDGEGEFLTFPSSVNGTRQVGDWVRIDITYYDSASSLVKGLNVVDRGNIVGSLTLNFEVQELDNHVVKGVPFYVHLIYGFTFVVGICFSIFAGGLFVKSRDD